MKLVVKGVTVTLGSRDVLKDVTFEVGKGGDCGFAWPEW